LEQIEEAKKNRP